MGSKSKLPYGIYEHVLNNAISRDLEVNSDDNAVLESIDEEEASKVLAKYISEVIEKGLANIKDNGGGIQRQIQLCNDLIQHIVNTTERNYYNELSVDNQAKLLMALIKKTNTIHAVIEKTEVIRPVSSIARSSLFTGALHEPSMYSELKKEILSCDRIDMLVSFIKWSGLRLILDELKEFVDKGKLRIITTSYMGATDVKAIEALGQLQNTEIKISYDTKRTRLHAKTYVFYRDSGYTTAYVGSSNLSNAAISSGLEWNVKITEKDLPDTINKINATFESYWNSEEFSTYSNDERSRLEKAIKIERNSSTENTMFSFDINPFPFQAEILERLEAERKVKGHYRNLVVAATGTGKTVISAFDFKRFTIDNKGKPCRLLFVAHREEILKQSRSCFRAVLKDANFGDLYVGSYTPESIDHLFISIQTFNSKEYHKLTTKDFYDYIVIDEFHHAAAPIYQSLLEYYQPKILLGLTATPERMDGKSVIEYFDNRIAAEIRLPEAIDRKLLSPFHYFGVTDNVDLSSVRWSRNGYDKGELDKILTENDLRAKLTMEAVGKYCTDVDEIKGLGFCVSINHAIYMAEIFNKFGIPSICLTGLSDEKERDTAKKKLTNNEIRFIFVVDLYNEGVDIPEINTILFLRPTESLTVFLQQLGRGLRLSTNKDCLTVLDFIGQANKKYNFEEKFKALLSNTTKGIQREVKDGFMSLPKGCFIQLEKVAKQYILENIRNAIGYRASLISRIATFEEDSGLKLTLANFIGFYHIDIKRIYEKDSFSRLCATAGVTDDFHEPDEELLKKAFERICDVDSRRWIEFLVDNFPRIEDIRWEGLTSGEKKYIVMLFYTIFQKSPEMCGFGSYIEGIAALRNNPTLFNELIEILNICKERIDFIDEGIQLGFDNVLDLHCSYTRDQIMVALDFFKPNTVREGVKYLPDKGIDIFFITLNKSDKDYSPTTMYNDYSESEYLFHWQSQSTTSDSSNTGQRYINHKKLGSKILLFVREFKADTAGALPYTFLGLADYVRHYGNNPMNIIWKLHKPIPAKYLRKTNKLIVG